MAEPQNLKNHARIVPGFHILTGVMLVVNLFGAVHVMLHNPSATGFHALVLALSLAFVAFYARAFAVGVQDRVIRLEMRLRVKELVPPLASRFDELAIGQVVALRFAGDDELGPLMQQVLDGKLAKPADIKAAVKHWKADRVRV